MQEVFTHHGWLRDVFFKGFTKPQWDGVLGLAHLVGSTAHRDDAVGVDRRHLVTVHKRVGAARIGLKEKLKQNEDIRQDKQEGNWITYFDTEILLSVSSRSFLMIFPSLPMMRPQKRSSANIFSGTSLKKHHAEVGAWCCGATRWRWVCAGSHCLLVADASSCITSRICRQALLQFSGWPKIEITWNKF